MGTKSSGKCLSSLAMLSESHPDDGSKATLGFDVSFWICFVRDKCMLLSCLHFSPILPLNNESVSASRDSEVIIHKVQIL